MTSIQRVLTLTFALLLPLLLLTPSTVWAAPVQGKVVSSSGEPVSRALVVFVHGNVEVARTSTANDGRFFIRDLGAGTYTVKISRGNQEETFRGTQVKDSNNDLRFEL